MKTLSRVGIILLLQIFVIGNLSAQKLSEKLNVVKTNFTLTFNGENLQPTNQFIAKKARYDYNYGSIEEGGYGYGYGYESYFFEFATFNQVGIPYFSFWKGSKSYILKFYDNFNQLIGSVERTIKHVKIVRNEIDKNTPTFFSIDLVDIPLILLDETEHIDIKF